MGKMMHRNVGRMTRSKFESFFAGKWKEKAGGRFRVNGEFKTAVQNGEKVLQGKGWKIVAKSWDDIFKSLKMEQLEHQRKSGLWVPGKQGIQVPKNKG